MDGIHDLGGREGFGPVRHDADAPAFHARWEGAMFAIMLASGRAGAWANADQFRHGIERIDPRHYLNDGYYGRWLGGIETLLIESGLIEDDAVNLRLADRGTKATSRAARPAEAPDRQLPSTAPGSSRPLTGPPRFAIGTRVRTIAHGHAGHTRLPTYARNRCGTVVRHHGGWVFPDTNAHGLGEHPCHVYTVAFAASTLYGADADANVTVHLDLFEPYLEIDNESP